jgi:hypothetical protein
MYNMDISIFGYKLNLQVLILIGVIYLILVGHTLCGCSNYNLMESFTDGDGNSKEDLSENVAEDISGNDVPAPGGGVVANKTKGNAQSKEGFVGANINYGESSAYDLNSNVPVDTSSWSAPNMTVVPGQPLNPAVKQFLARKQQQLPLPEGEMDFFANSEFKPECCPNTYSNSTGCWCGTSQDFNYLTTRGGNNVPYSEY